MVVGRPILPCSCHRRRLHRDLAVLTIFYFTYAYFVVSDYLAASALSLDVPGQSRPVLRQIRLKLLVALIVISVGPLAAILVETLFTRATDCASKC